jgi:hypothetical protein
MAYEAQVKFGALRELVAEATTPSSWSAPVRWHLFFLAFATRRFLISKFGNFGTSRASQTLQKPMIA